MKYENQRPDLADQIKALVQSANSVKTVPHGIKTVNPGEGLQLVSGDGQEIFWDWETAAEYDSRISEGREAIDQAKANLAQARLDLDAAAARVAENQQLLDALGPRVDDAQSQVTQTAQDLTSVDTRLTTTAGELSTLKTTVGDVSAAAATAEGKAARAESTAAAAQSTAQDAMAEYDGLRVKLDAALAAKPGLISDSSFELVDQWSPSYGASIIASAVARTGSRVLVMPWQNTNPAATKAVHAYSTQDVQVVKDHRYRFTAYLLPSGTVAPGATANIVVRRGAAGERVYIGNMALMSLTEAGVTPDGWRVFQGDWTAPESYDVQFGFQTRNLSSDLYVDDFQVVDSTEEASLQIAVEDARQKAEAASAKAVEAMTAANLAQTAADGKTTVTATVNAPSGVGLAVGDLHRQFSSLGSGGQILREWRWNGTTWVDHKISSDFLSHVDVGKLSGVFANISQHLQAGSIGTDYLTVGVGRNLVPNGGGQARYGWENFGYNDTGPATNNGYPGSFWIKGRANAMSEQFSITPGTYAWRVSAKGQHDGGRAYVQFNCFDNKGTRISSGYLVADQVIPNGTWSDFSGEVTVPAGTVKAEFYIYGNHPNGVVADDYQWFTGFALEELVPGQLVVNGSITGNKVDAESVAAKVGQFVKVQATNVEVTSELAARVVNAMTANVRNLVVTESAILQHTTLLGTTVASELNVIGTLRGRDAILDGTVDINQLNVTTSMSAEIVKAMDIQARRGIFTEGLTAADATLLGTTVAENLNAGTVASRIMTGGLLQTTAAASRGVKIDNSGIKAWDDSGSQTVNISGTANYIVGEFSTAPDKQRVRLRSRGGIAAADFFGSNSTVDHLGVWHTSSSVLANTVSKIVSMPGETQQTGNPGLLLYPTRGEFAFDGRWAVDSPTLKFWDMSNFQGLTGGGWADLTWTYANSFASGSKRMPYLSVEARSGAECVPVVMEQTATYIKVRVVNKSTNPSGPLYVRCVVFNINSQVYSTYG